MEEKYMNVTKIIQEELGQMLEKDGFQSDFKKNIWTYEREKNGVRQEITILTDRYNKKISKGFVWHKCLWAGNEGVL